jgi:hypothetical protein
VSVAAGPNTPGRPDAEQPPTPNTAGRQKRFAFNPETKRMEIVVVNTSADGSPK